MKEDWDWNSLRGCWELSKRYYIYHVDGKFVLSSDSSWYEDAFDSFEEAEVKALQ